MEIAHNAWRLGNKINSKVDPLLGVRLGREPGKQMTLYPTQSGEPLMRSYLVTNVNVKHEKFRRYASSGELSVSAERFVIMLFHGENGKGAQEYSLLAFPRALVALPEQKMDRRGKITKLTLRSVDGDAFASFTGVARTTTFEKVLAALDPTSAAQLGPEAAAERKASREAEAQARREREERAAVERQAHEREQRAARAATSQAAIEGGAAGGAGGALGRVVGGVFDHRKTWHFRVGAAPSACVNAFSEAFSRGGGVFARAKWDVTAAGEQATATYLGRKGLATALTMMSERASNEQDAALGSQVQFDVLEHQGGVSTCVMWLALRSSSMGFTMDARFFRPYLRAVEDHLRRLDPATAVARN